VAKRRKNPFVQRYLRYPLEALGLKVAILIIRSLSPEQASNFCGWLGRTVGPRLGISHRAEHTLALAFPEMPKAEHDRILRDMWDNLGRVVGEYGHLQAIADPASGRVECVGLEHIEALRRREAPGIFFAGHLANWEIIPAVAAREGIRLTTIVREPNNPLVRDAIAALRGFGPGQSAPKGPEGARQAVKVLKDGGVLGLLIDQKMNKGLAVPFFGHPAKTAPALAQLALRFGCPVYPARVERLGPARFRLTCYPPLELPNSGDRASDTLQIMTAVNKTLEAWIRERPAEWLWLHRRWPREATPS
jgi:KDO2-lipid IV(A) lauroyltransferase